MPHAIPSMMVVDNIFLSGSIYIIDKHLKKESKCKLNCDELLNWDGNEVKSTAKLTSITYTDIVQS